MKYTMIALMMMVVTSATAMSYTEARHDALFLSDKMAYELDLTDEQYEAAYQINLDYLMALNYSDDVYGYNWKLRNRELRTILAGWQYNRFMEINYFYRPVYWSNGWSWRIYDHYNRDRFYRSRPVVYVSYRGGNDHRYYASRSWRQPARQNVTVVNNNYNYNSNRSYNNMNSYNNMSSNRQQSSTTFGHASSNRSQSTTTTFGTRQSSSQSTTTFGGHRNAPQRSTQSTSTGGSHFGR